MYSNIVTLTLAVPCLCEDDTAACGSATFFGLQAQSGVAHPPPTRVCPEPWAPRRCLAAKAGLKGQALGPFSWTLSALSGVPLNVRVSAPLHQ